MKTIEHFVKSLSRLSDKKFFEISRNVLGDVKTPYHRQIVIKRLVSSIENAELQNTLFSYITEEEALIINAVELFDDPSLHDIHDFLTTRFSYTECIRLVTLLEERLVLYSYLNMGWETYALNPVFAAKLQPILDNRSALFPCVKKKEMRKKDVFSFSIDKMFLFAFFSYVHSGKIRIKINNELTKKAEDQAKAFFNDDDFFDDCFFDLLDISIYLDLLEIAEKACVLKLPSLERFFKLSDIECRAYFAAGLSGNKKYARLVLDFLALLSPETYYTKSTVDRMLLILFRKFEPYLQPPADVFLAALKKMGLLVDAEDPETGEKYITLSIDGVKEHDKTDAQPSDYTQSPTDTASIVFDSPFSFVLLPNVDILSVFDLIHFSTIENIREYRFTVNKETVVRCLETAVCEASVCKTSVYKTGSKYVPGTPKETAAWIIDRLQTLSGDRLDETLVWTINEWEKRFGEVILHEGLVLYLGKERRYLAETADLKPYLAKALTEDVFVINPAHRETVVKLLSKSGADIIGKVYLPPPPETNSGEDTLTRAATLFPPLAKTTASPVFFTGDQKAREMPISAIDYREKFRAVLASLDMAEAEKQEILLRIDRGLIFSEEQLKKLSIPGTFPYEKNKADGMDYGGKLLLAKNAFVKGTPVELTLQSDGKEISFICTIERIEKKYAGDVLVILGADLHQEQRIPLGKVSEIKKIKQSIFE